MISNDDIRNYLKNYIIEQDKHEQAKRTKKSNIINSLFKQYKESWIDHNQLIKPKFIDFEAYLIYIQAI
jgi:hypothetical protein